MAEDVDARDVAINRATPERKAQLDGLAAQLSQQLPAGRTVQILNVDPLTGNPAAIRVEISKEENGPGSRATPVQQALTHLKTIRPLLGLGTGHPAEFVASVASTTSGGAEAVHFQQHYKGIPVFDATLTVRFAATGQLVETLGRSVSVEQDMLAVPRLRPEQSVVIAANHVAGVRERTGETVDPFGQGSASPSIDVSGFTPRVITAFADRPEHPTLFEAGPFGAPVEASLVWFPLGAELVLAWEVLLTVGDDDEHHRTVVDSNDGRILYYRQQ